MSLIGHVFNSEIQVTIDTFKPFMSVLHTNLRFSQKKSTLGQGQGAVSSSFACD